MTYHPKSDFIAVMMERGFLADCTDYQGLDEALSNGVVPAYIGFDATAKSLHVGSLIQIMMLRWLQKTGHKPITLMGGGTTKVGDPSFRADERPLLGPEQIDANIAGIKQVFAAYINYDDAPNGALMLNNAEWLDGLNYLDFLRDIGRHFSINRMLSFESVKSRLDREQSLSFLEFNYMILQAYDFLELNRRYGCLLQMGGSDQWGNIVNGIDLTRRVLDHEIYGLTSPLSAFDRRVLEDQQQFGDQDLFALDWSPESATRARLNGTPYIWTKASLSQEEWTLHLLSDVGDIRRQSLLYVAIGVTSLLLLVVAAATYRAAQLRMALANSDADRRRLTAEIEERKLAEQKLSTARVELARKNQLAALGQLSASITHELGQPISAMRNYLVAEEIATDATPGSLWPELTGLVDRMQRILDQLRLFGRSRGAPPELFNLQDTLRSALQLVRHTADEARVALITDLPEAPCMLTGEPDRFEQVIVNLLRNGIDAARGAEGPQIKITLSEDAEFIVLSVSDNGVGFGDLEITDLREPFFSTKPSGQGMGLGLAISGQIVNEMGGSVSAQNNPKRGATFSVTIPKSDP